LFSFFFVNQEVVVEVDGRKIPKALRTK